MTRRTATKRYRVFRTLPEVKDVRRDLHECLIVSGRLSRQTRKFWRQRGLKLHARHFAS